MLIESSQFTSGTRQQWNVWCDCFMLNDGQIILSYEICTTTILLTPKLRGISQQNAKKTHTQFFCLCCWTPQDKNLSVIPFFCRRFFFFWLLSITYVLWFCENVALGIELTEYLGCLLVLNVQIMCVFMWSIR